MKTLKEETLWEGRPSYWNWWPTLLISDLLLLLAAALWSQDKSSWSLYAIAAASLLYLFVHLQRLGNLYTLTNHRVISRTGLFSRHHDEVEIRDIRNISLDQSFFQRLLGLGDIGISSAGGEGVEVSFEGIESALNVKEKIRHARLTPATDRRTAPKPESS